MLRCICLYKVEGRAKRSHVVDTTWCGFLVDEAEPLDDVLRIGKRDHSGHFIVGNDVGVGVASKGGIHGIPENPIRKTRVTFIE